MRRALRSASQVVPLAWSAGGRRFSFQAPLTLDVRSGGYAVLSSSEGPRYLGQVLERVVAERPGPSWKLELESKASSEAGSVTEAQVAMPIRLLEGAGELLARIDGGELVPAQADDSFREAELEAAPPELAAAWLDRLESGATLLDIGRQVDGAGRARLRAEGFARHTFLCGQSGAGKTFALGVVLERLLLETDLRLVILDPNGDYVGLGAVRTGSDVNRSRSEPLRRAELRDLIGRYRAVASGVKVFSKGYEPLKVRFGELSPEVRAEVLGLDPLADRDEYSAFVRLAEGRGSLSEVRAAALKDLSGPARELALRIDNLGICNWDIWAGGEEPSVLDAVSGDERAVVIDLSSVDTGEEQAVVAGAVLTRLWRDRAQRNPALVVIDEAHNICPSVPALRLQREGHDQVVRIGGEGRKYGLYLLLVTQRPDKLEPNALSQCDNLMLLRLNGAADVERLAATFSFVPPPLLAEAPSFTKGEALLVGGIVTRPTRASFEGRLSHEGGADVPTAWATRP